MGSNRPLRAGTHNRRFMATRNRFREPRMGYFTFNTENWRDARGMQLAARVDKILLVGTMGFACGVPGPRALLRGLPPAVARPGAWGATVLFGMFSFGL